jgi:hypothetical protein
MIGEPRFDSKINYLPNGCWLWTAAIWPTGYAQYRVNRRTLRAHRYAYQVVNGKVPPGLDLDHLCRNRACVNPAHLEPVTHSVNLKRGINVGKHHLRKTHCPKGHPYDEVNTYRYHGKRMCRACAHERDLRRRAA